MRRSDLRPAALVAVARVGVWRLLLPVARRTMSVQRLAGLTAAPRPRQRDPEREQLAVRAAGRWWRSSEGPCLERSLALHRELGRLGASPVLVLGMAREPVGVVGHAWVELDGRALLERDDPREAWTALVELGPDGRRLDGSSTG